MRKPEIFVYSELRNQTSSTPYWPMIRYHVKQDAITRISKWRNGRKKYRLGQNSPNLILILLSKSCPSCKMSRAVSPFTDGCSRILQHAIFESRFLGIYPSYNFLWLWCELTSVAFSGSWQLETLLRLARCKAKKTIIPAPAHGAKVSWASEMSRF